MHVLKGSLENSADSMRTRICVPALAVTELESLKLVKTVCSLLTHYYNSTLHLLLHYNLISLLITFVLLAQSENWELNQIFDGGIEFLLLTIKHGKIHCIYLFSSDI